MELTMPKFNRSMRLLCASSVFAAATCIAHAQAAPAATDAATPPSATAQPQLEPKAVDILKAACAKLAAAKSMSFTAIVTYESPSRFGMPLAYGTKSEVLMQRPNKLRVITRYDGPPQEFYYDGQNMTAYAPNENFVAVASAPPTLDEMLSTVFHTAAIYFPFDDVIVTDPYKDLSKDLRVAFYIGQSQIVGGITTDIVAYDTGGVFIQAWIGHDDHLPRILRAIYVDDPAQIRHNLVFNDWKLDPPVPANSFSTAKAATAKHIPFGDPNMLPGTHQPTPAATAPGANQ
jgi:hypothetical protein